MTITNAQPAIRPTSDRLSPPARALIEERRRQLEDWQKRNAWLEAQPEDSRDQYLNGRVVPKVPARANHARRVVSLTGAVNTWAKQNGLGEAINESAMVRLAAGDVYPDVIYWPADLAASITPDVTIYPTPTFVVEVVSPESEHRDRVEKFAAYAEQGIEEYWIIDPEARVVECYDLGDDGRRPVYVLRERVTNGPIEAKMIEGFSIKTDDLFGPADGGAR